MMATNERVLTALKEINHVKRQTGNLELVETCDRYISQLLCQINEVDVNDCSMSCDLKVLMANFRSEVLLADVVCYKNWHNTLANDELTDDEWDELYNSKYTLTFRGKSIELPFHAEIYNAVYNLLEMVVEEW